MGSNVPVSANRSLLHLCAVQLGKALITPRSRAMLPREYVLDKGYPRTTVPCPHNHIHPYSLRAVLYPKLLECVSMAMPGIDALDVVDRALIDLSPTCDEYHMCEICGVFADMGTGSFVDIKCGDTYHYQALVFNTCPCNLRAYCYVCYRSFKHTNIKSCNAGQPSIKKQKTK